MLGDLLPQNILNAIAGLKIDNLQEIRLRRNGPIVVCYKGQNQLLLSGQEKIFANSGMIEYILRRATENSLYAYTNEIRRGFITAKGGIRIGLAGESVGADNFMPSTIKNIHSLNIRIPHEVKNCSAKVFKFIYQAGVVKNTLIISPPGAGKTTLLRDLARKISEEGPSTNVLLVDERYELAACENGESMLDVGEYTDVITGANKKYAFTSGIRALRPDVIITDELIDIEDANACKTAIRSGVKVLASIHANSHIDLLDKQEFKDLINGQYFERIVVLSNRRGVGTCEAIYDEKLKCIFF